MSDVAHLLRELEHRAAARRQYLHEHQRLETLSRELFRQERIYEGEGAHYWAMIALQAAESEMADRPPQ